MQHFPRILLGLGLILALSCQEDSSIPTYPRKVDGPAQPPRTISVMTRNMYVGADVDVVIAALASPDPTDDFPALLTAVSTIEETDLPSRVKALAQEIVQNRPHVIGLQEVTELDIDLTAYGEPVVLHQDFLAALLTELGDRGLDYAVAARNTNIDAAPLPGIRLVDHDALLFDASRVSAVNPVEMNFHANIGVVAPGVEIKRGWVAADVVFEDGVARVVSTHPESGSAAGLAQLRALQAQELVTSLGSSPAIVLGDFNDTPGSPIYEVMMGAGFQDMWSALNPDEDGMTCCNLPDLSNETATFDQRIDYIFARGTERLPGRREFIHMMGDGPADRIRSSAHRIWPSDHAGLMARLQRSTVSD